jgi:DNA-binding winged helix-turn-helix (wHTH) protein
MAHEPIPNETTCPCCGASVAALDLLMDPTTGIVSYDGKSERLSPSHFRLLKTFIDRYPNVVTKDECLNALSEKDVEMKLVDVQVCKLRPKADKLGLIITTVWGTGYRLELEGHIKAEVLRAQRFSESRRVRYAVETADLSAIRMLRAQGYPLTDIGRRLRLAFRAVATAIDIIEAEDAKRRDRTRAA